jgi:hypothetical protein
MALTSCPECNNPVSTEAVSCPRCGHPLKAAPSVSQGGGPTRGGSGATIKATVIAVPLLWVGYQFFIGAFNQFVLEKSFGEVSFGGLVMMVVMFALFIVGPVWSWFALRKWFSRAK